MQATDKFAQIASAYSILSDPTKKREYDHSYKYGAFDNHIHIVGFVSLFKDNMTRGKVLSCARIRHFLNLGAWPTVEERAAAKDLEVLSTLYLLDILHKQIVVRLV